MGRYTVSQKVGLAFKLRFLFLVSPLSTAESSWWSHVIENAIPNRSSINSSNVSEDNGQNYLCITSETNQCLGVNESKDCKDDMFLKMENV